MRVIAINAGSATLKFGVFESARTLPLIDSAIDHPAVDAATFEEIERHLHRAGVTTLDGIGHRVAHGGPLLSNAVLVDEEVEREIGKASALAPHHNPAALAGIRLTRERWPGVRHVAVFDTAFHDDMPEYAHSYAVPPSWRAAGVRRYG
ncbi:acetate/propionate family kinase, partial [Pseudomonas aeruginosa]|nr:acetate/propionate family kinase [Pseudomonas aeruginosa]